MLFCEPQPLSMHRNQYGLPRWPYLGRLYNGSKLFYFRGLNKSNQVVSANLQNCGQAVIKQGQRGGRQAWQRWDTLKEQLPSSPHAGLSQNLFSEDGVLKLILLAINTQADFKS